MTAIPKPASTVVLMDHKSRIYLTKRPITMKFMGGFYVFPGGAVEAEDEVGTSEHIKSTKSNVPFSLAHYVAAARELFEEVGVLLCRKGDGSFVQLDKETERAYRRQLVNREISFLQMLKKEGLFFNPEGLTYFGHRITPKMSPIRFDTRFFIAMLPEGQSPTPDQNEIDDAFWATADEALSAYQNGKITMASPTVASLRTIINHQKGAPLMMPERKS